MEHHSPERESLWRRKLSMPERADLDGQPELELEARLTDALARLPSASVPSNFTARVLNAIDLEEARSARAKGWRWDWHVLWPRVAVAAALLLLAGVGIQRREVSLHHAEMAKTLSTVASVQTVPDVDALNNFDVIQRMSQPAHADTDLLAALQ